MVNGKLPKKSQLWPPEIRYEWSLWPVTFGLFAVCILSWKSCFLKFHAKSLDKSNTCPYLGHESDIGNWTLKSILKAGLFLYRRKVFLKPSVEACFHELKMAATSEEFVTPGFDIQIYLCLRLCYLQWINCT